MKKTLFAALLAIFSVVTVSARDYSDDRDENRLRKKYRNISFVMQKSWLSESASSATFSSRDGWSDSPFIESKWGAAFTTGRSYILHRRPIVGLLHIGLDATWFDINYVQGRIYGEGKTHQGDIAMGFGPSVHLTPVSKLGIHTYIRYNPTFATFFEEGTGLEDIRFGYASMWVGGAAVSWDFISLGAEARWGKGKYNRFGGEEGEEELVEGDVYEMTSFPPFSLRSAGVRMYVSFRF